MLLGHPLAERGGERAKCKAEVVAGILDEGSVMFNVQSNMHNIDRNAFDDLPRILPEVKLLFLVMFNTILVAMLLMSSPVDSHW